MHIPDAIAYFSGATLDNRFVTPRALKLTARLQAFPATVGSLENARLRQRIQMWNATYDSDRLETRWGCTYFPTPDMSEATFRVVKIDPEGSGVEWSGHLGSLVLDAHRCCGNCTLIFAGDGEFGPFVLGELEPLNEAAENLLAVIKKFAEDRPPPKGAIVIRSKEFDLAVTRLAGRQLSLVR